MLAVVVAVVWLTHNLDIMIGNAIVQHGSAMTNFDRLRQSTGETLDRADKTLKSLFK